jgi:hypothetical protein
VSKTMKELVLQKAKSSHRVLSSALDWVAGSADAEVSANQRLEKRLRTGIYQARRLGDAVESKMCIGVYGPSQSGKSYLVSALARKHGERLIARVGDQEIDFIQTINPEGGKESTGLVTRFTVDHSATPVGFPIQLKLLGELDLIKLFVNSYVNDILQDEDDDIQWHQEQVQRLLLELESMPHGSSPLSIEDVYELEDYCNGRFSSNFRIQALKRIDFWQRAAELLPVLGDAGRLRLVQALWEDLPSYSEVYANLVAELGRLAHAALVYCAPEAMFNTEGGEWTRSVSSIINVTSLNDLGKQDAQRVMVSIPGGGKVTISLPNLCALTSELVISMREKPHEVFDRVDLLDFPGARSRQGHPKRDKALSQPNVQIENFLRGKVAYLFDKYSADLELTSMVLCIGPSNQEVVGLEAMIEDWIAKTHGEKPEAREKLQTSLFFVLTKFDTEFAEGAGKSLDGVRWSTRLQASLINSFGSHAHRTNWVSKWTTKSSFKNTFWLRNPNADQSGLIDYVGSPGSSLEVRYAERKTSVIETLKSAFLANTLVQQHFDDPAAAWDAGMTLNDGGASFLLSRLDSACTDDLKIRQIDERINRILSDLRADLAKYYASNDFEGLEREKLEFAKSLTASLAQQYSSKRLGEFIDFLLASDIEIVDTFKRTLLEFERAKHAKRSDAAVGSDKSISIDRKLAEELGLPVPEQGVDEEESQNAKQRTFPEIFVQCMFDEWRARCITRFSAANLADYLIADREIIMKLLTELEVAARRDGLVSEMVSLVEKNYQYKSDDRRSWVWRQTASVTARFNAFISHGGMVVKPGESKDVIGLNGKRYQAFSVVSESVSEPELPEIQAEYSERYLKDWIQAMQHSVRTNAAFQAGLNSDVESNRKLGLILEGFAGLLQKEQRLHAT